jgi:N-acetylglucosaminyldiphosphoundecaprenol N-acetyl-beta-D-mannosaminyltransferase
MTSKYNFIGIGVDILTYDDMLHQCDHWLANKSQRSRHIACVNVNCVVEALLNQKTKALFNSADIVGPDGMPFVYWIRIFSGKKCDRFYAPDIVNEVCRVAPSRSYRIFLYGGTDKTVAIMQRHLEQHFPGVNVVGAYAPPFRPLTAEEDSAVCHLINSLAPDFIFVGLGSPKQDIWIREHLESIPGSVMVACGATFDFFGQRIRQAPVWIQRSGFEWLFRFLHDPRRLWRRYTYYNAIFLWNFLLQLIHLKSFPTNETQQVSLCPIEANS